MGCLFKLSLHEKNGCPCKPTPRTGNSCGHKQRTKSFKDAIHNPVVN